MNCEGSRLQDPSKAYGIWSRLKNDDDQASKNRAQVDAMVNGEPPFDQKRLDETGQSDAANFNTREASAYISQVASSYYDLVTANNTLVRSTVTYGDAAKRRDLEMILDEEFTRLIRNWDAFEYWYNLMVHQHVVHGIGITFFGDEIDWRFRSCGLSDFKLPRDCPATEDAIPVACALIPTPIDEVYRQVKAAEEAASADCPCHWDLEEAKRLITEASEEVLADNTRKDDLNWEHVEKQIKENAAAFGAACGQRLWLIHFWVKEDDGTITHGILPRDTNGKGWLYFNKSRFDSIQQALVIFPYDLGSGTYHTIRGLGYLIQPQVQANNALACRMADGAMAATMNLLQVVNPNSSDNERMALAHFGNNEILPAGVQYIDRKLPDYTQTVLPVMRYLQDQLKSNTTGTKPHGVLGDKNAPAIAHQLDAQSNASLSASALNRFYIQLDKLFSEMFRRAKDRAYDTEAPGGKEAHAFRKALKQRDFPLEALSYASVTSTRAVGAGSPANRVLTFQRLERIQGALDPEGRRNLFADIVAEEVGYENAKRYVPPTAPAEQRAPIDAKLAELENFAMESGKAQTVAPNQDHFVHAQTHLPPLLQLMDQLEQAGENAQPQDLMQVHSILMTSLPHVASHAEFMSVDRARRAEAKEVIKILQQLSAAADRLRNQIVRLQKAQEEAALAEQQRQQEQQAAYVAELERKAQEGGPDNAKIQAKLVEAQVMARLKEAEFNQKLAHKEREFNQQLALRDAAAAKKIIESAGTKAKVEEMEEV
jgi:hypothetical protein